MYLEEAPKKGCLVTSTKMHSIAVTTFSAAFTHMRISEVYFSSSHGTQQLVAHD